jgi:transposase
MHVGWDWGSEGHDVTVLDEAGQILERFALSHDEAGLEAALQRLRRHGAPAALPVAIETSHGLVVERLLEAGHPVVPVHPNAFHAARPRWGAARAKSDPGDSYRLADYLRTDGHRLRRLRPLDPTTRELQALVRARGEQLKARVAATNQLAALLERHWPGPLHLFSGLDTRVAMAFLDRYPTPQSAVRLGEDGLARFLERQRYSGRRSAAELLARLRAAPRVADPLPAESVALMVRTLVRLVRTLVDSLAELERAMAALLARHAGAGLLAQLPGTAAVSLAKLVAEVVPVVERAADVEHACAEAGASPVTRRSGKSCSVHFRRAVNKRARDALALFADGSRRSSAWAARLYQDARARGKDHPHAVRILMRAWLRVIWACWHTRSPYDPSQHGAERRLSAQLTA